ncbi:MAG: hypothetical protein DWQ05_07970 [Calditrichaeota bacterium]|nr:MAG: hypothetical protein DWQ05_07970 [Calditrichota bacterium]
MRLNSSFKKIGSILLILVVVLLAGQFSYSENNENITIWPSKSDFASLRRKTREIGYVYSQKSEKSPQIRDALEKLSRRSNYIRIIPTSSDRLSELETGPLCFIGTPGSHDGIREFLKHSELGIKINSQSLFFNGEEYRGNDLLFLCASPNKALPGRFFRLITAASENVLLAALSNEKRFPRLIGDYSIYQSGQLVAYGFLDQKQSNKPWHVARTVRLLKSPAADAERDDSIFQVNFIGEKKPAELILASFLKSRQLLVEKLLDQMQIDISGRKEIVPIQLDIFESTEKKFLSTQQTGFSSWDAAKNTVSVVVNARVPGHDFTAIAECIIEKAWGEIPNKNALAAAGILFSENWGQQGYRYWAGLFYNQNLFTDLQENLAVTSSVSNFISGVTLAAYFDYYLHTKGLSQFRKLLAELPSSNNISNSEFITQSEKYAWKKWCDDNLRNKSLIKIPHPDSFQAGFCYAHEGYNVYNGYLGSTSAQSLKRLASLNVNAVSLTPFAYFGSKRYLQKSDGVRQENDESLIIASQFARSNGMKIMLKPHIWVSWQSWPGAIEFATEKEAERFFSAYEDLIMHYAILAQMQRFESLCIGVELVKLTRKYDSRWRDLIKQIRKVYSGQLIYAANWGEEFEKLQFWDALDAIGLNSYYPLSDKKTFDADEIEKNVAKIFNKIKQVKNKFNKPVYFTEIGFASRPESWRDPHVDGHNKSVDLAAQLQCFQSFLSVLSASNSIDGVYIWKWPTYLGDGGNNHSGFTPNGKPAEHEIRNYFKDFQQKDP